MDTLLSVPIGLEPIFTCDVDSPIPLFVGDAVLKSGGRAYSGQCTIRFAWRPSLGPEFVFNGLVPDLQSDATLEVQALGLKAAILARRTQFGTEKPTCEGLLTDRVEFGSGAPVNEVLFHLANFRSVIGERIRRNSTWSRGRITLSSAPWVIEIDAVEELAKPHNGLEHQLKALRGNAITHVGVVRHIDGSDFDVRDVDEVLHDVSRTLSFARAGFSSPFLRVGVDRSRNRVWQSWTAYKSDAWRVDENWFSSHSPEVLQSVFAGWRQLAGDKRDIVAAAMHLYVDAHTPGLVTESRLVLLQAALEGLAFEWPFQALNGARPPLAIGAAGRILNIAVSLGVPLTVPPQLPELLSLSQPAPTATAIEKMTWVRNSIAHLENLPRLNNHPARIRYEAKQVAALHLELAILRVLKAQGQYRDRIASSAVYEAAKMPWLP